MNNKNKQVLNAIFTEPKMVSIMYADVETLLYSLGAEITNGKGSRRRFSLNGRKCNIDEPHKRPNLLRYQVDDIRSFLQSVGIFPD